MSEFKKIMGIIICGIALLFCGSSAYAQRIILKNPTTFYLSPTGSDDADGLTANTPWHTLQHAYNTVKNNYDLAGFPVTIHLADGTYKDNVVFCDGYIVGQVANVIFQGNPEHPENVVLFAKSNNIFEIMNTRVHLDGMTLSGTGSTVGILSYFGARVTFTNLIFGPMGTGIHLSAFGGIIIAQSDYRITGGAGYHILSNSPGSRVHIDNRTVTISNSPAFTAAFAVAENLAMISAYGNNFPGTAATGTRYIVNMNSIIQTSGDANYFPGDKAGAAATGGQYAGK